MESLHKFATGLEKNQSWFQHSLHPLHNCTIIIINQPVHVTPLKKNVSIYLVLCLISLTYKIKTPRKNLLLL